MKVRVRGRVKKIYDNDQETYVFRENLCVKLQGRGGFKNPDASGATLQQLRATTSSNLQGQAATLNSGSQLYLSQVRKSHL